MMRATVGALALMMLAACGGSGDESPSAAPAATVTVTKTAEPEPAAEPEPEPTEEVADENYVPKPADFKIKLKILEKECFGSAGCNVTYRIDPSYVGRVGGAEDASYEITYKVTGGEDGPIINTFTIDDSQASFDNEEYASTRSQAAQLKAIVTEVSEN